MAPGAIMASKLAGADYLKTAIESSKVGAGIFVIPFLLIWVPALLLQPMGLIPAIIGIGSAVIVMVNAQIFVVGYYLRRLATGEKIMSGVSLLLILAALAAENYYLTAAGFTLFVLLTLSQIRRKTHMVGSHSGNV